MRIEKQTAVKWLLSGAAFCAVVAGAAGCGSFGNRTIAAVPGDFETMESAAPPINTASVSVMGEVNGVEAAPATSTTANFQQHTTVADGADSDVVVDPTGKFIAFASTRHGDHSEIYLQKVGGQSVTQLTSDAAESAFPCFSPDGKRIAFSSTRAGNWDIYVMDNDGRNVVQVSSGAAQDMHPSFSPDGDRLVFASLGRQNQWELWTVSLSSGEKKMIGYGLFPAWSPEQGRERIAFQRARQRGSRCYSLWTLDLVDGEACKVTEVAASTNAAIVSPAWSPDGKQIAFATLVEQGKISAMRSRGQQDIWAIDADGGNRRRLTDGTGTNLTPAWSVDNRVYFVSSRGGAETVWSVKAGSGLNDTASAKADEKQDHATMSHAATAEETATATATHEATAHEATAPAATSHAEEKVATKSDGHSTMAKPEAHADAHAAEKPETKAAAGHKASKPEGHGVADIHEAP